MIAVAIATTWLISLIVLLPQHPTNYSPVLLVFWILSRTFLHTGLFVIAHDAIHGNVFPGDPSKNRWVGRLALGLYGFLPYQTCRKLHWQHHAYPAQTRDPDFYSKPDGHLIRYFIRWYGNFMRNYLTPRNLGCVVTGIGLTTVFLVFLAKINSQNLILFWLVPWILSSLQLFTFGIFLPHYHDDQSNNNVHQTRSYYYPVIFSLLTCYHFSYHREHHAYPEVPWYQLPDVAMADVYPEPFIP